MSSVMTLGNQQPLRCLTRGTVERWSVCVASRKSRWNEATGDGSDPEPSTTRHPWLSKRSPGSCSQQVVEPRMLTDQASEESSEEHWSR